MKLLTKALLSFALGFFITSSFTKMFPASSVFSAVQLLYISAVPAYNSLKSSITFA